MHNLDPFYRSPELDDSGEVAMILPHKYAEAWREAQDADRRARAPEGYQPPHFAVPEAWAIDLDKTLIDNHQCMENLFAACAQVGVDLTRFRPHVAAKQAEIEGDGRSFEPLSLVQAALMPDGVRNDRYRNFERAFVTGPDIYFPDARRFLRKLQWSDVPHIIPTKGVNPEWQYLKLAAGIYAVGRKTTDHPYKGYEVSDLMGADGKFHLYVASMGDATYTADVMHVAEDKPAGFEGLPDSCGGLLIRRGEPSASQSGEVPDRVRIITSFDEMTIDQTGRVVPYTPDMPEPPMLYQRRLGLVDERKRTFNGLNYAVYLPVGGEGWHDPKP